MRFLGRALLGVMLVVVTAGALVFGAKRFLDAREQIAERLSRDAHDYIGSCARGLSRSGRPLTVEEIVTRGHHLGEYRRIVEEKDADLLVMNTKDQDQLAMHGLAYPLAIEVRTIPLLLL